MASDDPDRMLLDPARMSTRTDIQLASAFDKRNWVCEWVYGCVDAVTYAAYMSANQIDAAATATGNYLRTADKAGTLYSPLFFRSLYLVLVFRILQMCL
jgi:hypothetical protein